MWGAAGRGPREYWNPLFLLRCLSMHPMLGCVGGLSKRHGAAFFLGAQALMLYQTIKAHFFQWPDFVRHPGYVAFGPAFSARWRLSIRNSLHGNVSVFSDGTKAQQHPWFIARKRVVFIDGPMLHLYPQFLARQCVCLFWRHDGVWASVIHCTRWRERDRSIDR